MSANISIFIERIREIISKVDVPLHECIQQFIHLHHGAFSRLSLEDLVELRNHFSHAFDAVVFYLVLLEFSKQNDLPIFRPFTVFLSQILLRKRGLSIRSEDYQLFMKENYFAPYGIEATLEARPDEEEAILAIFKSFLKEIILEDLEKAQQFILEIMKVAMQTNSELATFAEEIGTAATDDASQYRPDLSEARKQALKNDMLYMSKKHYQNTERVFGYLLYSAATEAGYFYVLEKTELRIFQKKIQFELTYSSSRALNSLESFKSPAFVQRLSMRTFIGQLVALPPSVKQLLKDEEKLQEDKGRIFLEKATWASLQELSKINSTLSGIHEQLLKSNISSLEKYVDLKRAKKLDFRAIKQCLVD